MNKFTIGDMENLTGIKAHTLRIWEQRYQLPGTPKRASSGHRFYDNEDLKSLLRISNLYHSGIKISKIARMDEETIKKLSLGVSDGKSSAEHILNALLERSIDLDHEGFERLIDEGIAALGLKNLMLQVLFPLLSKLGLFWVTGHIIPSQEHLASEIIIRKLLSATHELPAVSSVTPGRNVVVFTPAGEFHEIPILFAAYLLRKSGISYVYFGRNVGLEELKDLAGYQHFDQLYFHLITNFTRQRLDNYLTELHRAFPSCEVYFSGLKPEFQLPQNTYFLETPASILSFTA
jgi:DNA-binding transcriptional MerR regulator